METTMVCHHHGYRSDATTKVFGVFEDYNSTYLLVALEEKCNFFVV